MGDPSWGSSGGEMSPVGSDSKAMSFGPEVLVPLEQLENLTPRIRRGYTMTYPLFPRQDEEEEVGLFLETTACCN